MFLPILQAGVAVLYVSAVYMGITLYTICQNQYALYDNQCILHKKLDEIESILKNKKD